MNKKEFLNRLRISLSQLPEDEIMSVIRYFEDYFQDAFDKDEADVIKALGAPEEVAAEVIADYKQSEETSNNKSETNNRNDIKSGTTGFFHSIEACLANCSIKLLKGEERHWQIKSNPHGDADSISVSLKNEILVVEQKIKWNPIFNFRRTQNLSIEITLPEYEYKQFKIETVNGGICAANLAVKMLKCETVNGGIRIDNVLSENASFETVNGGIHVTKLTSKKIAMKTVNGGIVAKDIDSTAFNAEGINCSLSIYGALRGTTSVETVNGPISINTSLASNEYNWEIETLHGRVLIDGKHSAKSTTKHTNAPSLIKCESANGSITLNFNSVH